MIFELALTFQLDQDCVDVPAVQHTNNLCQKSFHLKVIVHTHAHTHWTDCSTWTIKIDHIVLMDLNQSTESVCVCNTYVVFLCLMLHIYGVVVIGG